jgi:hypothetical protein
MAMADAPGNQNTITARRSSFAPALIVPSSRMQIAHAPLETR